ncbi:unnamed protein product [Heligmosomoides polygyrus]|uniref:Uncharacterized protein n=1 Tax=Heligmosomoides polygyrus TaxID=6339 RepID=A0A183FL00_HELPZ|nr:unnamed protein product [Heligmosomoides polygyrus]
MFTLSLLEKKTHSHSAMTTTAAYVDAPAHQLKSPLLSSSPAEHEQLPPEHNGHSAAIATSSSSQRGATVESTDAWFDFDAL